MAEPARLALAQFIEADGADGDTFEAHHLVLQLGEHAPYLAVLAFGEDDLQPGALALRLQPLDALRLDVAVSEPDTGAELLQLCAASLAGDLDEVRLFGAKTRATPP